MAVTWLSASIAGNVFRVLQPRDQLVPLLNPLFIYLFFSFFVLFLFSSLVFCFFWILYSTGRFGANRFGRSRQRNSNKQKKTCKIKRAAEKLPMLAQFEAEQGSATRSLLQHPTQMPVARAVPGQFQSSSRAVSGQF